MASNAEKLSIWWRHHGDQLTVVSSGYCNGLAPNKRKTITWTRVDPDPCRPVVSLHYNDGIMSAMASQIISVSIVYLAVCSGSNQRKHQSSAPLAFVREIHRWPMDSPHKGPVTLKMFPFAGVIMEIWLCCWQLFYNALKSSIYKMKLPKCSAWNWCLGWYCVNLITASCNYDVNARLIRLFTTHASDLINLLAIWYCFCPSISGEHGLNFSVFYVCVLNVFHLIYRLYHIIRHHHPVA